jgi:hypothetical protein
MKIDYENEIGLGEKPKAQSPMSKAGMARRDSAFDFDSYETGWCIKIAIMTLFSTIFRERFRREGAKSNLIRVNQSESNLAANVDLHGLKVKKEQFGNFKQIFDRNGQELQTHSVSGIFAALPLNVFKLKVSL